jgi:hypothetical protein
MRVPDGRGDSRWPASSRRRRSPPIPRPRQFLRQFLFDHRLDETPHLGAQIRLDRSKLIVEKLVFGRIADRLRDISLFGVISFGVGAPILLAGLSRRLRHLQIRTTSATAPYDAIAISLVCGFANRGSDDCDGYFICNSNVLYTQDADPHWRASSNSASV